MVVKPEVDWDLEAGAIVRRANELRGPAVLFKNIKGYPGHRMFGGPLATHRRLAIAMGLPAATSVRELQEEFERRVQFPIKPEIVKKAPCQENVIMGEDVDLFRFPAPMMHEGDGGRYIGTWHAVVTKDPASDWMNWGMYRVMVQSEKYLGLLLLPHQHVARAFYRHYLPQHRPMPVSIAIGPDPLSAMVAATRFQLQESEVDYAGALQGRPVELVKCVTSDLLVPAHAEIILECELLPGAVMPEGPFGEFTGYRTPIGLRPVMRVKAITHRDGPILTMSCVGTLLDDSAVCQSLTLAMSTRRYLEAQGVPVKAVHLPLEFMQHLVVVSVKTGELKVPVRELRALGAVGISGAIVVDDDVDVFNLPEVLQALATRCHPGRSILINDHAANVSLTPFLSQKERKELKGARVVYDCTWPREWTREMDIPPRVSFDNIYSAPVREKVLRDWSKYGFKDEGTGKVG